LKQVMGAMAITAGVILVIGWMAPAPWMLAGLLVAALMVLWLFAISRWIAVKKPTGTELQPDSLDDSP
jgi:membrane protein implicated in regulation of membrane protease activity